MSINADFPPAGIWSVSPTKIYGTRDRTCLAIELGGYLNDGRRFVYIGV